MTLLDWFAMTRDGRLIVWLAVLGALSGSLIRTLCNRNRRPDDSLWALIWFFAVAIVGYNIRWVLEIAPMPETELDAGTRLGLNVLLALIGLGVLWKRWEREGWRW